ncbi:AEC family transporter [Simiduia curdlanivorans]|uniref:AEC family transporter n=1 Tax=Simiduia curdlanivorans TaxID=1492769 RepID=A0ABV8V2V3_9GAMM|nr:AEC family transporter [Simiduia curdlanivorans]MDN3640951.1 AEC family transporter [Simiduia curdlanivorans]
MTSPYLLAIEFTLSVTAPIFLIVFLGLFLKRTGRINDEFIGIASKLVFNLCLPLLMFFAIIQSDIDWQQQHNLALFSATAATLSFFIFWWLAQKFIAAPEDRGVAVQSAFRSNLGIMGIALCAKAFAEPGLAVAALILAVVTPIYNVLSIYALTRSLTANASMHWGKLLLGILKNPLILSIGLAFVFVAFDIKLPTFLEDTGRYLSRMTLPLALITIGGSLSLSALRNASALSAWVVFAKIVLVPVSITGCAWLLGFRGIELGCILLMFASPTAAAAFVMTRAIGGNHHLASNTIAISTLASALTISTFLYGLNLAGIF